MRLSEIEDMVSDYNEELIEGEPMMTVEEMGDLVGYTGAVDVKREIGSLMIDSRVAVMVVAELKTRGVEFRLYGEVVFADGKLVHLAFDNVRDKQLASRIETDWLEVDFNQSLSVA